MNIFNQLIENYPEEEFKSDDFDNAVIGMSEDFNAPKRLIYSVSKYLEILMKNNNWEMEEALEFFTFNISGSYVGEKTPVWCWDNFG